LALDNVTPFPAAEPVKPFRRQGLGYVYEPPSTGVRFYVDHAALECDTTKSGKKRAACRLIWPIPDGRKNDE